MRFLIAFLLCLSAFAQDKQSMAVLGIEQMTNDPELHISYPIREKVQAILLDTNRFQMVERQRLDAVVEEGRFQASGFVNPKTAIKVGQMTGAKLLVVGVLRMNFGVLRTTGQIDLRVIETETGNILYTFSTSGGSSSLSLNASTEKCLDDVVKNLRASVSQTYPTRAVVLSAVNTNLFLTDIWATEKGARYRILQKVATLHPMTHERIETLIPVGEARATNKLGEGSMLLACTTGKMAPGMFAERITR